MLLSVIGFPSSKVVQLRIYNVTTSTEVLPWASTGISERADGSGYSTYFYNFTGDNNSSYIVDWKDNSTPPYTASESFTYTTSSGGGTPEELPPDTGNSQYGTLLPFMQKALGNRPDLDTESILLSSFNAIQNMLSRMKTWDFFETTREFNLTPNDYDYTFDECGLLRPLEIQNIFLDVPNTSEGRDLIYFTPKRWDIEIRPKINLQTAYRPSCYTIRNRTVYLFRKPDIAYPLIINYKRLPAPITENTQYLEWKNMDEVLQFGTLALAFLALEEETMALKWEAKFNAVGRMYGIENLSIVNTHSHTARPSRAPNGEYWNDPFTKRQP